jgi:hypothetical protein
MAPLYFVALDLWWEHGISDATGAVVFYGPPVVVVGIAIFVAGRIADQRESRKAFRETDGRSE